MDAVPEGIFGVPGRPRNVEDIGIAEHQFVAVRRTELAPEI